MPVPTTTADLAQLVEKSQLVENHRLAPYLKQLQAMNGSALSPKDWAAILVRDGLLTKFQAKLLLQGKWRNFFIGGKYKVLEHLGAGGMGTVYLCEHRFMRRRVAVKLLPPDKAENNGGLERFRREAQAIARLDHPNIVRAHDIDQDGPIHFLVMEFVDGVTLQHLVDARGPLGVARSVNYIAQAAQGLHHAYRMQLVHRDIKPSNLLLDRGGTIKILDLGLARFQASADNLTRLIDSKTVLGTADYLAPEQARDSNVDIRADIYSLGAMLFFVLTGKPPFDGGNVAQKLIKHQATVPPLVTTLQPDVPKGLAAAVAHLLEKDAARRPQTPADVVELLRPWLEPVDPPTPEEMPATRYSPHRDLETMSRISTIGSIPATTRSQLLQQSSVSTEGVAQG
jgi:eukaryotic-like serine/threonine-protein kinase